MKQMDNLMVVEHPRGQITFHKDLQKYVEVRNQFFPHTEQLLSYVTNKGSERAKEAHAVLEKITGHLLELTWSTIIPQLSAKGIYDLTDNDFVGNNPGYQHIFRTIKSFVNYVMGVEDAFDKYANSLKDDAFANAQQSVTGPGYSVISNDWTAHAIYAAKAQSVIKKQAEDAEWAYYVASSKIDSAVSQEKYKTIRDNIKEEYYPQLVFGINLAIETIITQYCRCLEKIGQFDFTCLDGIDETRSNSVLENLRYVADKEAVINQAIQLCPYNANCYMSIYQSGVTFQMYHREILMHLGATDATDKVCHMIEETCVHTEQTMSKAYQLNARAIEVICFLQNQDKRLIARTVLMPDFQRMMEFYTALAPNVQKNHPIFLVLQQQFPNVQAIQFEAVLKARLLSMTRTFSPQEIAFCNEECGIDVLESLTAWFGFKVESLEALNQLIESRWASEKESVIRSEERNNILNRIHWVYEEKKKIPPVVDGSWLLVFLFCAGMTWFSALPFISFSDAIGFLDICLLLIFTSATGLLIYSTIKMAIQSAKKIEELDIEIERLQKKLKELS